MTTFIQAIVSYDNRCPLPADVASQITLALEDGFLNPLAVQVTTLVRATMSQPDAGSNLVSLAVTAPDGTDDFDIQQAVENAILDLDLPTAPSITVQSVTVF
jgi:hypothetical protein